MRTLKFIMTVVLLSVAIVCMSACDDENGGGDAPEYPVITELSEREFSGTVDYVANPPTTDPVLPGVVAGLRVDTEEYVLIVDGNCIGELPMVYGDMTIRHGDKVKVTGKASRIKLSADKREYSRIEVEQMVLTE